MRIEQGVKVADACENTRDYEEDISNGEYYVLTLLNISYVIKKVDKLRLTKIAECYDLDIAIKIAKLLNENLKRGDV